MLYALQRALLFPAPAPRPHDARAQLVEARTPTQRRAVAAWWPASAGDATARPTVVYLHGNGMQLADAVELGPWLHARGFNLYAIEYPGYGPLHGDAPSEVSLLDAARASMEALRTQLHVPASRTVLLGQSLGTGVAVDLASRGEAAALVLLSPYRSIADVAQSMFGALPVRWLVRDRFDSAAKAPSVRAPVWVIHGTADEVIPFAQGASLAERFARGRLVALAGAHHNDLWSDHADALEAALREAARAAE